MWETGARSPASAAYSSKCGCRANTKVAKGRSFPDCPICAKPTMWADKPHPRKSHAASSHAK